MGCIKYQKTLKYAQDMQIQIPGPEKSIAQLPGTSPNFGWARCPEKSIEYIGNIVIPSHFQDAVECRASG